MAAPLGRTLLSCPFIGLLLLLLFAKTVLLMESTTTDADTDDFDYVLDDTRVSPDYPAYSNPVICAGTTTASVKNCTIACSLRSNAQGKGMTYPAGCCAKGTSTTGTLNCLCCKTSGDCPSGKNAKCGSSLTNCKRLFVNSVDCARTS